MASHRFLIVFSYQGVLFKAIPLCTVDMLWNLLGPFEIKYEKYCWLPRIRSRDTKNYFVRRFSFAKKKRLTKQYRWQFTRFKHTSKSCNSFFCPFPGLKSVSHTILSEKSFFGDSHTFLILFFGRNFFFSHFSHTTLQQKHTYPPLILGRVYML